MSRSKPEAAAKRYQQEQARAEAIQKMEDMLREKQCTSPEMAKATRVEKNTLNGYLRYMQKTLRKVRIATPPGIRPALWELGADPSLPSEDEVLDRLIAPKRGIHKAVQIGIPRDPLVAALFGPANQQEHKEAA